MSIRERTQEIVEKAYENVSKHEYTYKNDGKYILIQWPESQELMDEPWFDECSLAETKFGKAAYFVPFNRYKEWLDKTELEGLIAYKAR